MGEIAGLRAGTLDNRRVAIEQGVDLACQGLDLGGKIVGEALRFAATDRIQSRFDSVQWPQSKSDLQKPGDKKQNPERPERPCDDRGERADVCPHCRNICADENGDGPSNTGYAKISLRDPQTFPIGARRASIGLVVADWYDRQYLIPQRP